MYKTMRNISVADYLVEVLIANKITDVFGYQGGMIAYIFDSLGRYKDRINYHSCATEQGAAISAAAYAKASGKFGVAISTSGPGFTNLLTGMADAWFDSVPVLYISGNVNTKDKKRGSSFRQNGFQEIQAVAMAAPITKKSVELELGMDYVALFDDAIRTAMTDRRGPIYLDLPINICRERVDVETINPVIVDRTDDVDAAPYIKKLVEGKKPVIIAGAGIKQANCKKEFRKLVELLGIPVVTTLPAIDVLPTDSEYMMGYIGGTARREAGIVLQNADFVMSLGTRLCSKQVGHNLNLFAPKANGFIRVDIDSAEFERKLKPDEKEVQANLCSFIKSAVNYLKISGYKRKHCQWAENCAEMYRILEACDMTEGNEMYKYITALLPESSNIVFDVGKNLTYGGQSGITKMDSTVFMSAGLGTMGYAIPGAIGAAYGNHKPTYAFTGDGGAQMNIQELNTIAKNKLPIKIIVFNNRALGNIRIFQEQYLDSRFVATSEKEGDYFSCDFKAIAEAYGIKSIKLDYYENIQNYQNDLDSDEAVLFEITYEDCPALPGIVAGGEFLKEDTGIERQTIKKIKELMR
jgi:acetolactate synthase-1/2/3 large subunit